MYDSIFYEIPTMGKYIEAGDRLVAAEGWGSEGRRWKMTVQGCRVSFWSWGDENVIKLIMIEVEQLCEYTSNH